MAKKTNGKKVKIQDLPTSEEDLTKEESKKVKGGWQGPITTPNATNPGSPELTASKTDIQEGAAGLIPPIPRYK